MRRIVDYFDKPPKTMTVKHLATHEVWKAIIIDRKKVESEHYNRRGVKKELLNIFNNCCGYCEARITNAAPIEHFRPKSEHQYYWLGVTWSNLIASCSDCNSYKGDHFEVDGKKATLPPYNAQNWQNFFENTHIRSKLLVEERPRLLHPVLDEPSEHLRFEADGTVQAISDRGDYLISCCKLSDFTKRRVLVQDRQLIIERYRNRIVEYSIIKDITQLTDLIENLLSDMIDAIENYPFSAVHRACFERFSEFFIASLDEPYRTKLQKIYNSIVS